MQLQGQTSEAAPAYGWISAELITVLQVLFFLVLGYAVTGLWKSWCLCTMKVSPKKLEADEVACTEQPAATCMEEIMVPSKSTAQARHANAQERKRMRKAKESDSKKTDQKVAEAKEPESKKKGHAEARSPCQSQELALENAVTEQEAPAPQTLTPTSLRSAKANAKKNERKNRKGRPQTEAAGTVEGSAPAQASHADTKTDSEDGQTTSTPTSSSNFETKSDSETSWQEGTSSTPPHAADVDTKSDSDLAQEEARPAGGEVANPTHDSKACPGDVDCAASSSTQPHQEEEPVVENDQAGDDELKPAPSRHYAECAASSDTQPDQEEQIVMNDGLVDDEQVTAGASNAAQAGPGLTEECAGPTDEIQDRMEFNQACSSVGYIVNFDDIESDSDSEQSFKPVATPSDVDSIPEIPGAPVMWCSMPQAPTVVDGNSSPPVMMPQIEGWMAVAVPAECAPPGAFDGLWQNNEGERILIERLQIMFESGITWNMEMHSVTNISVQIQGEQYHAELDNSGKHLLWSDGDVWTFFGHAEQAPEELQQWSPEALAELPHMNPEALVDFPCMMMPVVPGGLPTPEEVPMPPKNQWIPRDAKKWEICWDWGKKGWCPRGADCDWYHPTPGSF